MSEQQPGAPGIEVDRVHRAFGPVVAVDEMTFTAPVSYTHLTLPTKA